jgi:hypothetical protein
MVETREKEIWSLSDFLLPPLFLQSICRVFICRLNAIPKRSKTKTQSYKEEIRKGIHVRHVKWRLVGGDDGTGSSSTFWVVQVVNRRKQNKWGRETQQDKTRNINNLKTSSTSKGAFQTPLFLSLFLDGVFSAVVVDQPKLSRLRLFGTIAERDREREREEK